MKNLLILCLVLLGVIAQAQNEKLIVTYQKLGIVYDAAKLKEDMRLKNQYPAIRLCVYLDEEIQKLGIVKINRAFGHWVVVAETGGGHTQTYITNPKTKKRMVYFSHDVPQRLVPDYEGYIPTTFAQYMKLSPIDQEAAKWGFLVYKTAAAKTKKFLKDRK